MAKTDTKRISKHAVQRERDGTFLLKLVLVILLGTVWLKFNDPVAIMGVPFVGVPLGAVIGIFIIHRFETINEDRKIWFAILLVITLICYFVPAGIMI